MVTLGSPFRPCREGWVICWAQYERPVLPKCQFAQFWELVLLQIAFSTNHSPLTTWSKWRSQRHHLEQNNAQKIPLLKATFLTLNGGTNHFWSSALTYWAPPITHLACYDAKYNTEIFRWNIRAARAKLKVQTPPDLILHETCPPTNLSAAGYNSAQTLCRNGS